MALLGRYRAFARLAVAALLAGAHASRPSAQASRFTTRIRSRPRFFTTSAPTCNGPPPAPSTDTITIAVLGDAAVAAQLAQFLPGRRIEERPVEVRPIARIEDLGDAEVLFIGRAAQRASRAAHRRGRPATGARRHGRRRRARPRRDGELSTRRPARAIRNLGAARRGSGLTLSSRLLSAAFRVRDVGLLLARARRNFARNSARRHAPDWLARRASGLQRHEARDANQPASSAGAIAYCTAFHPNASSNAPEPNEPTATKPSTRKSLQPCTFACSAGVCVVPSKLVAPMNEKFQPMPSAMSAR